MNSVEEPINKFDLSKKSAKNDLNENNEVNVDYYSSNLNMMFGNSGFSGGSGGGYDEGRQLARQCFKMRQDCFEKASEAYARGWGHVAQYYAEMGHRQTKQMDNSNEMASVKIFSANNPDIKNSNTLDLHGLHVNEAINVLKNVFNGKRKGFYERIIMAKA